MIDKLSLAEIIRKANHIRKEVVDVSVRNGAGHIAPSLSTIDILVSLYYRVMNISRDPQWPKRDRLIFSKGHGCYGLYAILAELGYIRKEDWKRFYKSGFLSGCIERSPEHGLEASCGSLGHGLPQAVGVAFGAKLQGATYRVFCIAGDGEMQEGSNWEAIQFAVKHRLSNLTLIIDKNGLQAMDFLKNVLTLEERDNDLEVKLNAFGFQVSNCNGHDPEEIINCLEDHSNPYQIGFRPRALVASTIKGYGLKCMEHVPKFHFRLPTEAELAMGKYYE